MFKNCTQCGVGFEMTPKMCPLCRQQRRLSMRNERKLYNRKCDLSGREYDFGRPLLVIY